MTRKGIVFSACFALGITVRCAGPRPPVAEDFLSGCKRILFLGDSITQNGAYVGFIEYYLNRRFPGRTFDIVSIGLSSETVSGLTEPGHPYPRPCLHDRLGRALEKVKPGVVVACYGMNDGIYHPPDSGRSRAFQDGIRTLVRDAREAGADAILVTPPPFDPLPVAGKLAPDGDAAYGYASPYSRYDDVLEGYSRWLMDIRIPGVFTVDLHGPMSRAMERKRRADSAFCFSPDGVHPTPAGHLFMAWTFLKAVGLDVTAPDLDGELARLAADSLFILVDRHRRIRSSGWLDFVGYTRETTVTVPGVSQAEQQAAELQERIDLMRRQ